MTLARRAILQAHPNGVFHCTSRCVRRAYLCGYDRLTGVSYSHRRRWIEERIELLARSFAVSVHGYAIMENHFHIVLQMDERTAARWGDRDVARRWLAVYPGGARANADVEARVDALLHQPGRVATIRSRLASLSWFMRNLKEHIARRSNREDGCMGHFWESRFDSEAVLDDTSLLATMLYVDLNPIRAGMATAIDECEFTSGRLRYERLARDTDAGREPLMPVLGGDGRPSLSLTLAEYLALLARRSISAWSAFGRFRRRAVGSEAALRALAVRLGQRWVKGCRNAWTATILGQT